MAKLEHHTPALGVRRPADAPDDRSQSERLKGRLAVHFSSQSEEWATPQWLFDALDAEFGFTLDPCSTHANAKCRCHFTKVEDGLLRPWTDHVVFMNPPYGRALGNWLKKAYDSAGGGATVVCLIPARTDTAYWHRYAMKGEIRLLRGRLKFQGGKHAAPFPSALIVFRPTPFRLVAVDPHMTGPSRPSIAHL